MTTDPTVDARGIPPYARGYERHPGRIGQHELGLPRSY